MARHDLKKLQEALGHRFAQESLLRQALTHRSHAADHYERLEFLGDGLLNFVVAHSLYHQHRLLKEGDLSRIRAHLVRQDTLVEIAQRLELPSYLFLGEGELRSGGLQRPSILADVVEAVVGAIFLDAGFEAAKSVIERLYEQALTELDPNNAGKDAKTQLQEWLQSQKIAIPKYEIEQITGAAHEQVFTVVCQIDALGIRTLGQGQTRRVAEQSAAAQAMSQIQAQSMTPTGSGATKSTATGKTKGSPSAKPASQPAQRAGQFAGKQATLSATKHESKPRTARKTLSITKK